MPQNVNAFTAANVATKRFSDGAAGGAAPGKSLHNLTFHPEATMVLNHTRQRQAIIPMRCCNDVHSLRQPVSANQPSSFPWLRDSRTLLQSHVRSESFDTYSYLNNCTPSRWLENSATAKHQLPSTATERGWENWP